MAKSYKQEIFLEELPRWEVGKYKGNINWRMCVGHKIKFIYNNINDLIEIIRYIETKKSKNKLEVQYKNNNVIISIDAFKKCSFGKLLGKITSDFKYKKGQIFKDDKRNITIIGMEYREDSNGIERKYYKYHCNKDGYEDWIREGSLDNKNGCSACANRIPVLGINTIWDTDKWLIPIINDNEFCKTHTHSCSDKIYPTCVDCGKTRNKNMTINAIYGNHGICCPNCSDGISYPNKFAFNILEQLNVNFETEYSPEWIKPKRYDFYFELNNKEYILEMDGGLGHGKKIHSKDIKTSEESKAIDDYKDKIAEEHNIRVIRIDCDPSEFENIKQNILSNKQLNKLFDLSKIDWLKCNDFACSSRVKEACNHWNNQIHSTKEIAKVMKLHKMTIVRYLKLGVNHNWCDYDTQEEIRKNGSLTGKKKGKLVEIFKDEISLGIFKSCAELERLSEELFGTRLDSRNIVLVCNNKRKTHKGYKFKYI